jgi:mRNA-degrading endonuclease toxin of MazEF toxin-antitoxin module
MIRAHTVHRCAVSVVVAVTFQLLGAGLSPAVADSAPATADRYNPVSPSRVWDSRSGPGPVGSLAAGDTRDITVAGAGGVPETGATTVVLNVTAVNATAGTYITVWPAGESRPLASNLNVPPGDTRPNLVVVKIGAAGKVSFYNDAGTVDLIADVAGWDGPATGQRYTAVSPARVWDSRTGPGPVGRIAGGVKVDVGVVDIGGVPATGVSAVVLNVTAVNPTAATFVTAWPAQESKPLASNLNIPPGDTRPNLVIVKVLDFGHGTFNNGHVSFYNESGSVDLIADVAGYFSATGANLTSVSPARVWDSRFGPGPTGRIEAGGSRDVVVTGTGGVPLTGVTAVVLNVTAFNPSAGTFVTAWPSGEVKPLASNLNAPAGDTRANLVIVKVGAEGKVSFANDAGTVDLIADVAGWYGAPGA